MDDSSTNTLETLQARCQSLESHVAALTSFVAALLKDHPQRDQLQTRWADYLGPAIHALGPGLSEDAIYRASDVPGWVQTQIDESSK